MKIYIVKRVWDYDGCSDIFRNCHDECTDKIFDSEYKAIKYIRCEIRKLLFKKREILSAIEKVNMEECSEENCANCIACDDFISLDHMPTYEELKKLRAIEYDAHHGQHYMFKYEIYEVE